MTGIQAAIFDMDGTLVDNMEYHIAAWMQFLQRRGVSLSRAAFLEVQHGTMREVIHRILGNGFSEAELDAMRKEKESQYRDLYRPHLRPVEGLPAFLEALYARGVKIGLATAGDRDNIDFILDGLGLRHRFQVAIGAEEVTYGKPHPQAFLLAAARLGVKPARCVVFEDSLAGIEAGHRAGMEVIALSTLHTATELKRPGVNHIMADYRDILSSLSL